MAQVSVTINEQSYTITCDDGQEERLLDLAAYFDSHVRRIADSVSGISDSRLMLLAGLTVCDELKEAQARLYQAENGTGMTSEDGAVRVVDSAAEKIRNVTRRLEEGSGNS